MPAPIRSASSSPGLVHDPIIACSTSSIVASGLALNNKAARPKPRLARSLGQRALVADPPKSLLAECEELLGGQVTTELLRSQIEVGTVVCVVEAMKLFNEIESEVTGKIVKVMVEDASPVEYDQVLYLVDPKG